MPFEYQPPGRGPKGLLPKDKELPAELIHGSNAAVEQWSSGALPDGTDADVDVQALIAAHGSPALQAIANGGANQFDALMNGDNPDTGNEIGNIFDKDISHWVNDHVEGQYPFDHHDENMAFLNQSKESQVHNSFSPTNTLIHKADTANQAQHSLNNDIINGQNDMSFTNLNEDSNLTNQPISFDLPSTIPASFEPGTQDVTDTQMAERAQGEFDEFINHASVDDAVDSPHKDSLDLGASVLGKRKAADADAGVISPKKLRHEGDLDEDEEFTLAAADAFEANGGHDLTTSSSAYNEDVSVPRLFSENDFFSSDYLTAGTEATEMEDGGEVEQYGRA